MIDVVVEFGRVIKPIEYNSLPRDYLLATLDNMGISYTLTHVLYHGDGTCGAYDPFGNRRGEINGEQE